MYHDGCPVSDRVYSKYYVLTILAYTGLTLGVFVVVIFTGLLANNTYGIASGLAL